MAREPIEFILKRANQNRRLESAVPTVVPTGSFFMAQTDPRR